MAHNQHIQYFSYPGFGERNVKDTNYSQAVKIDNRIEISGQGGWDPQSEVISDKLNEQVNQAFSNVELTLKHAGGKGWSQVYKSRMYLVDITPEFFEVLIANLKKWCPDHAPLLTAIPVPSLALPGMRIEIEVDADLRG